MNNITSFARQVYAATKKIPRGRVATYLTIANYIGYKGAARAVGNALNKNPFAPSVPCHRVVKSSGEIGGFAFGLSEKIKRLKGEGVEVAKGKVVDFKRKLYLFK
ncbi:MAG: MGMT family protein [Candidatus Cloacimonetes bacterium]|jgi:methylated-DNA-[protein]-cysteine S-methyltransferase|nr:MGMT family protein [Candidatus Cloacimonadota bacterium]MDD4444074.1 MGMT family protein [Patescibacteria group bacterium]